VEIYVRIEQATDDNMA